MCSRFENKETGLSVFEKFSKDSSGNFILEETENLKQSSIAPTDDIIIIRKEKDTYRIQKSQWGIKFDNNPQSPLIFNSRIETIMQKDYWTKLFRSNRCIIPVTAFYEWKSDNGKKIPQRISLNENLFFILGIYTIIGDKFMSSLITTEPNDFMKLIHNRMPALTTFNNSLDFLNSSDDIAISMCKPFESGRLMQIQIAEELIKRKEQQ